MARLDYDGILAIMRSGGEVKYLPPDVDADANDDAGPRPLYVGGQCVDAMSWADQAEVGMALYRLEKDGLIKMVEADGVARYKLTDKGMTG